MSQAMDEPPQIVPPRALAYVLLGVGAIFVTVSELLMKVGATATAAHAGIFGVAALASGATWVGILFYIASFGTWIYVLKKVPLALAYALINVVHVTIPIGCYFFLHEAIPLGRWIGIGLVVGGLSLVIQQDVRFEERLETA